MVVRVAKCQYLSTLSASRQLFKPFQVGEPSGFIHIAVQRILYMTDLIQDLCSCLRHSLTLLSGNGLSLLGLTKWPGFYDCDLSHLPIRSRPVLVSCDCLCARVCVCVTCSWALILLLIRRHWFTLPQEAISGSHHTEQCLSRTQLPFFKRWLWRK